MRKKKKKSKKKSEKTKVNISLVLSIVAILISLGQLIFDNPYFLKFVNKVEISASELGVSKHKDEDYLKSTFLIRNKGKNTAKNVELHLRILKDDNVMIEPKVFFRKTNDNNGGIAKNLIYECDELVPGEIVRIDVYSDYSNYLKINSIDTLFFNKKAARPKVPYGPHLKSLKHSQKTVEIKRLDSLILTEIKY